MILQLENMNRRVGVTVEFVLKTGQGHFDISKLFALQ